ncbi:MAG TPA: ribosome maturation factor RimP [Candidatus Eisenbacteria bacterium]|jgi:ribosome maturation factor RimP|nr:ribosome maturation factor RimP [Candidatus Eisenbacteria bacterium]
MSLPFEIEQRRDEIRSEVEKFGAELVDISFHHAGHRSVITLIVDKESGVTLEDCVRINHSVSAWLDELSAQYAAGGTDFLKGSYFLEVNSPGLDRPLKTERDFRRALGQTLRFSWRGAENRVFTGAGDVIAVDDGRITVRFEGGADVPVVLELGSIVKAVREIKFKK